MKKSIAAICLILTVMLYGCSGSTAGPAETDSPDTIDTQETVTVPEGSGSAYDEPESGVTASLGETETGTDIPETAVMEDHTVTEGQGTVQPSAEVAPDTDGPALPVADITDPEETANSSDGKDNQAVHGSDSTDSSTVTTSAGRDNPDTEETTASQTSKNPPDETTRPVTETPVTEPQKTDSSGKVKDNEASMMTDF